MKMGEIPPEILLGDGDSVEFVFDPLTADITVSTGERGNTLYAIPVSVNGRNSVLRGGKRLWNALSSVVGPIDGPTKVRITASGIAGTFSRYYKAAKA